MNTNTYSYTYSNTNTNEHAEGGKKCHILSTFDSQSLPSFHIRWMKLISSTFVPRWVEFFPERFKVSGFFLSWWIENLFWLGPTSGWLCCENIPGDDPHLELSLWTLVDRFNICNKMIWSWPFQNDLIMTRFPGMFFQQTKPPKGLFLCTLSYHIVQYMVRFLNWLES